MARDRYFQALRGLAIAAVVLIHCLPQCAATVALRPFLNFSVALFLFLSGLLTDEVKIRGGVLRRRIRKVAVPYALWSIVYLIVFPHHSLTSGIVAFIAGSASAQMYYLLVYVQLVLLTPLLFKLCLRHRYFVYAITPACLLFRECAAFAGVALPQIQVLCPMWLIFYVIGLDWKRWSKFIGGHTFRVFIAFCTCLVFQEIVAFWWYAAGDLNMATTQLKISSLATSLAAIALFMTIPASFKTKASASPLVGLGNASFGIYLCHILVLAVVGKLVGLFSMPSEVSTFTLWALTLVGSFLFVSTLGRLLPKRIRALIGF